MKPVSNESYNSSELTTPLLREHKQHIHNRETVRSFLDGNHPVTDLVDANSVDGDWSLPPLPPAPYQSIPNDAYLQCSTVENPMEFTGTQRQD